MKKIFLAIAIIFVSLNCIGQGIELKVNKNGEDFYVAGCTMFTETL